MPQVTAPVGGVMEVGEAGGSRRGRPFHCRCAQPGLYPAQPRAVDLAVTALSPPPELKRSEAQVLAPEPPSEEVKGGLRFWGRKQPRGVCPGKCKKRNERVILATEGCGRRQCGCGVQSEIKAHGSVLSKGRRIIAEVSPLSLPSPFNRSLKHPIFCSLLTGQGFGLTGGANSSYTN